MKHKDNLIGQKFGKLLVIEEIPPIPGGRDRIRWKCLCDCGNEYIAARGSRLKDGTNRSCGCFKEPRDPSTIKRKYTPSEATAKTIFDDDYASEKPGNLTFEQFLELSQQNCFYCNGIPNNKRHREHKNSSQYFKDNSTYIFNGLDRIDSYLPHNFDNCVPCCKWCNYAKRERDVSSFIEWAKALYEHSQFGYGDFIPILVDINNVVNITLYKLIDGAYRQNYKNNRLSLDQFYNLSQQNCHYCNQGFSNFRKGANDIVFSHNGLDRVDSTCGHDFDNVVSCCKWCNYAKGNRTQSDFIEWFKKLFNHLKFKKMIE